MKREPKVQQVHGETGSKVPRVCIKENPESKTMDVDSIGMSIGLGMLEGIKRQLEVAAEQFEEMSRLTKSDTWDDIAHACAFQAGQANRVHRRLENLILTAEEQVRKKERASNGAETQSREPDWIGYP